jgi:branched-chain amino acid transport system substrate-binding protein
MRTRREAIIGATVFGASAAGLAGAARAQARREPIRVGVPTSQTGAYAVLGEEVIRGVQFAVDEANAAGGIDGRQVEFRIGDEQSNPDAARRAAERLALGGHRLLIGAISSASGLAIAGQLERWNALYVSTVNKADRLTGEACGRRLFRANHSDAMDLLVVGPWLRGRPERKWGICAADYVWGRDSAAGFTRAAQETGKEVALSVFPPLGTRDYAPYISQLKAAGLQGVWVVLSGGDAINFAKQARQFGLSAELTIVGHAYIVPTTLRAAGEDVVGSYGVINYDASLDTPQNRRFVEAWRRRFNQDPGEYEAETYTGMRLIFEGVRKAESTEADKVARAMNGLEFESPFGMVRMRAEDHQLMMPNLMGRVVRDGGRVHRAIEMTVPAAEATPPPSAACRMG